MTTPNNDGDICKNKQWNSSDENVCIVCFKDVKIYSVGECDHPVCYECSTRMRVLCKQNECPICRKLLLKVIFTNIMQPYRKLDVQKHSEFYSKKYQIAFLTEDVQKAFYALLDHQCTECASAPYRTLNGLKSHMRKAHNKFFCDICTEHLKIFTFERKCYAQEQLHEHRTKGDPDNTSHKGHPLCEYCNCRYLDRDELFKHLRRDHFFCHFCDADGLNFFYRDYNALAEHFRRDHFLCEEGICANQQFTGAFRSEIDFKAHLTNVHGKSLNKHQVKQARMLDIQLTLRRRPGPDSNNSRGAGDPYNNSQMDTVVPQFLQERPLAIDAQSERDFPSLGGDGTTSVILPLSPINRSNSNSASKLARTKENFPALVKSDETTASNTKRLAFSKSLMLKPNSSRSLGNVSVSSEATMTSFKQSTRESDFPALPHGKNSRTACLSSPRPNSSGTSVQSRNQNVSNKANPYAKKTIQQLGSEKSMVNSSDSKSEAQPPQLTTRDFPKLSSVVGKGNTTDLSENTTKSKNIMKKNVGKGQKTKGNPGSNLENFCNKSNLSYPKKNNISKS